jgi:hypothetical protein
MLSFNDSAGGCRSRAVCTPQKMLRALVIVVLLALASVALSASVANREPAFKGTGMNVTGSQRRHLLFGPGCECNCATSQKNCCSGGASVHPICKPGVGIPGCCTSTYTCYCSCC